MKQTAPARRGVSRWAPYVAAGAGVFMLGMSFAAVPLYRAFCAATGYGGTPQLGGSAPSQRGDGHIEIRFNGAVAQNLPWDFSPDQNQVNVQLGDERVAFFHAENDAAKPITGIAVYNITPEKAAHYFHKTACFCFNQQTLSPGQKMEFPVAFYVDPAIATDPDTQDVHSITLSYSFFRTLADARSDGALANAGEHVGSNPNIIKKLMSKGST